MHIPNVAILLQKKNPDILNARAIKNYKSSKPRLSDTCTEHRK